MHKMNWDDLRFVLAVADAGSVNAAATALGVNHATVLRRIAAFEARHGVTVFDRSAAGYRVRPGALQVIESLRGVGGAVDAVGRAIAGQAQALAGPLTITSTDSLCLLILPRHIRDFQAAYPGIRVSVVTANAHVNMSRLDADVTVRPARALPPDLRGRRATAMALRVHGAPGYWAERRSPRIAAHDWLAGSDTLLRSPAGLWQQKIPEGRIVFRADSFLTLAAEAQTGQGLAMLPSFIAAKWDNLATDDLIPDHLETSVWVAAHRDLIDAPRIRACVDYLAAAIAADPAMKA